MNGGAPPSLVNDPHKAAVIIGVLVERLGGVVTLTEAEVNSSLSANGGVMYVEVAVAAGGSDLTIEIFPKGFGNATR